MRTEIQPDLSDRDLRQRQIVPPEKLAACTCLVIGAGAIGRQAAIQLAAMGVIELTLIDFDTVDVVNLAPQGYMPEDIGQSKVQATAAWCTRLNPQLVVHTHAERFKRSSVKELACFGQAGRNLGVFCCVDSITARGIIWEAVKTKAAFWVDGRMSAEVIRILASDRPPVDTHYQTTLFAQDQAHAGACTARSTIYTASIAAGLMIGQFTRWLRGMAVEKDMTLNLLASELAVV